MLLNRYGTGRSHGIFGFLQRIFQVISMWWRIFIHTVFMKTRNGHRTLNCPEVDDPIVVPTGVDLTNPTPQLIAPCRDLLYLPQQPQVVHPLHKKLSLLAVLLSGMPSRVSAYRTQLLPSSRNPGVLALGCSTTPFSEGFCSRRQVHPLSPTILDVIAYLTSMYDRALQYTTIAAAKSVLAGVLHIPGVTSISSHNLIILIYTS